MLQHVELTQEPHSLSFPQKKFSQTDGRVKTTSGALLPFQRRLFYKLRERERERERGRERDRKRERDLSGVVSVTQIEGVKMVMLVCR